MAHDIHRWLGRLERGQARIPSARREERSAPLGAGFVPAAPVVSGTYVTPQTAIGLTSVFAAISCISKDVATLPLGIYKILPGGALEPDMEHPYWDLLQMETSNDMSALKFHLDSQAHVLGWGNSFAEIRREDGVFASDLHLMHPSKTVAKLTKSGRLYYFDEISEKKFYPEDILHFAGLGFDGIIGYTPLYIARQSLGLAMASEQFGAAFFGNGAISKGVLKTPKRLGVAAVNNLRRTINQVHQGPTSAHQFMVLEDGMEFVNQQIAPDDAQFLQTRQFQVLEVARLYNLPPHKIGDYSQSHKANIEESNLDYIVTTLMFWLTVRERELNRKLLTRSDRRKWVIRYDLSFLERGNTAARVAWYQGLRNLGAINADEIRRREGMNPLPRGSGGDLYVIQGQYRPLADIGKEPEPAPPEPGPAPSNDPSPAPNKDPEVNTDGSEE